MDAETPGHEGAPTGATSIQPLGVGSEAAESRAVDDLLEVAGRGELWMGHFQQLTTLTLGGGAALLVLLELGAALRTGLPFYVSLISCGVGLILCLGGQSKVLDDDGSNPEVWKDLREIRKAVFLSLAIAAVAFLVALLS